MAKRRHFGNVRQRESGRWQVRYRGPDGRMRSPSETFARKADALRYLTLVEAQIAQTEWTDPARAKVRLSDYAERWIAERPGLRPRTVELYRSLLRRHVTPWLGDVPLGKLDTPLVREWRARLLEDGVSASVTAKAYRLLRAVLMTAVNEDRLIPRNPCQVRGADREVAGERPVLSVAEVLALADEVPARFRAMILLTTFASLRFGEVTALERRDIDVDAGAVEVRRAFVEVRGKGLVAGPPKSRAGLRRGRCASGGGRGAAQAPGGVRGGGAVVVGVHRAEGRCDPSWKCPQAAAVERCPGRGRSDRSQVSRLAPHREHAGGP